MLQVVGLHVSPAHRDRYADALRGIEYCFTPWVSRGAQLSAGYDERRGLASKYPRLRDFLEAETAWRPGDRLVLVTWSAGTWAPRAWMRSAEDRALVDALVILDGLHAGRDESDPTDAAYEGILEFAREALDDPATKLLIVTTSEIRPPYASTTAVAAEMLDRLGITLGGPSRPKRDHAELPGLKVLDWRSTPRGTTGKDHADHVRVLGPQLLRDVVVPFARGLGCLEPPWRNPALPLGERCVLWSREQMTREPRPSAATLASWFSRAVRNGRALGITKGNHCAIAASYAALACALDGEEIPHEPRAAARELQADAIARGCWHEAREVWDGVWAPRGGDLAVYDRSKPGRPETSWWGHVDRVSGPPEETGYWNLGANEGAGGAWREQISRYDNPRLLGFVAYPRLAPTVVRPEPPEPPEAGYELSDRERARIWGLVALTAEEAEPERWESNG
jgi:hypothetical protein